MRRARSIPVEIKAMRLPWIRNHLDLLSQSSKLRNENLIVEWKHSRILVALNNQNWTVDSRDLSSSQLLIFNRVVATWVVSDRT